MDQRTPASPVLTSRDKKWLAAVVCLLMAFGAWAFFMDREPVIDPDSPAAQLARDDAAAQEAAKKELEDARAGASRERKPRLFLRVSPHEEMDEEEWRLRLFLQMDYSRCADYAGNADECRELRSNLSLGSGNIHTDPPLKGTLKTSSDYRGLNAYYSVPLAELPAGKTVRFSLTDLPDWVTADALSFQQTLPAWKISARMDDPSPDYAVPGRYLMAAEVTSNLPLQRAGLEERVHLAFDGEGGIAGQPEITVQDQGKITAIVPLLRLPDKPGSLTLRLARGTRRAGVGESLAGDFTQTVAVPERAGFVGVTGARFSSVITEDNALQPFLMLDFSTPVKTEEAAKAVSVRLLPRFAGEEDKAKGVSSDWSLVDETSLRAWADKSPAVPLSPVISEEYGQHLAFRLDIPPGRFAAVKVREGIPAWGGETLGRSYFQATAVPVPDPELRFMQDGTILSLAGARKLALASRGFKSLSWQAWRVRPEFLNLLAYRSSDFTDPDISGYSIELDDISDKLEGEIPLRGDDSFSLEYSALDLGELVEKGARGIFQLNIRGRTPQGRTAYLGRFVLLTDIGLVIKKNARGEQTVFATSFSRGGPLAGAAVRVVARNGVALFSSNCDESGKAKLPDLAGFRDEKEPVAVEVRYNNDMTYMLLRRQNHDTVIRTDHRWQGPGGEEDPSSLGVFLFSERGIYRPGEPLRFGLIAKSPDWVPEATDALPLRARLFNPLNQAVAEQIIDLPPQGAGELSLPTGNGYPTGGYTLKVYLGNAEVASHAVRLEEFQPDRIKAVSRISGQEAGSDGQAKNWLLPVDVSAEVQVENLYGVPAQGSVVRAHAYAVRLAQGVISYKDYAFSSPGAPDASQYLPLPLGDKETDESGKVRWSLPVDKMEKATYRLVFQAEAFEEGGGRSVSSSAASLVSPHSRFIGWRSDARLGFLAKDAPASAEFIAVGREGVPEASGPLQMRLTVLEYRTMLVKINTGMYRYETQQKRRVVKTEDLSFGAEGVTVPLPTEHTGEFQLALLDEEGATVAQLDFTVAGGADRHQGLKRDATLRIRLDKQDYTAGEPIQVFISAPYAGAGLITLEGDDVYAHSWFRAETTDSVQTVTVPEAFQGRAFLMVHMLRDMTAPEVHADPSAVAVAPFTANIDQRDMRLRLQTPELVYPGNTMEMTVSAERPGKVLVWAVDEGVLRLTGYQTPSALRFFLREKLHAVTGVSNWNLLMAEQGLVQRDSAFGGDLAREALERLNPFKRKSEPSVVYWSGLKDVGPGETRLTWSVPAYFNGRVRVMALAAGYDAVGEAESKTLVRAPVIITPTLPVAVAPGDVFDVSVALTNNLKGSGKAAPVRLNVALDDGLVLETAPPSETLVDEGRSTVVTMRLRAAERLGESVALFTASIGRAGEEGANTVKRPVAVSVRPAAPRMSVFSAGRLTGEKQAIPVARDLYPQFAKVEASLSGLPLPLAAGLSGFLTGFPHGCTEQVLSAAFPYVLLKEYKELLPPEASAEKERLRAVQAVAEAVRVLRSRQVKPGRYALWPQQNGAYPFLTVYGLDFLLSAREAGFSVPQVALEDAARETRAILLNLPASLNEARLSAYAAWVYTRAGAKGIGERYRDISRLIKHCDEAVPGWRADVSAALLSGAYGRMLQAGEAEELIKGVAVAEVQGRTPWQGDGWFFTPLWANGLSLRILAEHFPDRLDNALGKALLIALVNDIGKGGYTTTGAVQAIGGITRYAEAMVGGRESGPKTVLEITARNAEGRTLPDMAWGTLVKRLFTDSRAEEILFSGGEGLYWQVGSDGFDRVLPPGGKGNKLEVRTDYIPVRGGSLKDLKQGDDVYVVITARTTTVPYLDNVAITSLLPGGFEQVISREGRVSGGREANGSGSGSGGMHVYVNSAIMGDVRNLIVKAGIPDGFPMGVTHADRREDRMIVFASLDQRERVFVYLIKAVNKGTFSLPVTFAEALYDPDARARTGPGKVDVR